MSLLVEMKFLIMSIFESIRNYGFKEHWKGLLRNTLLILSMSLNLYPQGQTKYEQQIQTQIVKSEEYQPYELNKEPSIKVKQIHPPKALNELILKSEPASCSEVFMHIHDKAILTIIDVL